MGHFMSLLMCDCLDNKTLPAASCRHKHKSVAFCACAKALIIPKSGLLECMYMANNLNHNSYQRAL
jgi:hypothetical protein